MGRIGIFGGTFDPIHIGHLIAAQVAADEMGLSKMVFIPCGIPHHKIKTQRVSAQRHRLEMTRLGVQGNPIFTVSDIEIRRPGNTYAIDTLRELKAGVYKDEQLEYIIGTNTLREITTWRNYEELFELCEFVEIRRESVSMGAHHEETEKMLQKYSCKIHKIDIALIDVSSTYIRNRVRNGKTIKYFVAQPVEEYIYRNKLYTENW